MTRILLAFGLILLCLSIIMAPQTLVFGQGGMPGIGQCVVPNCNTEDCYRQGGLCPSNADCKRLANPPLCGGCICKPDPNFDCFCK